MAVAAERTPEVRPSLADARELARSGNAIPIRMTFVDDCETPVSAFLKLRDGGPCFLLESAEQGRLGRYSFLGFRPRAMLRYADGRLSEWRGELAPDADERMTQSSARPPRKKPQDAIQSRNAGRRNFR